MKSDAERLIEALIEAHDEPSAKQVEQLIEARQPRPTPSSVKRYALTITPQGRNALVSAMTPTLVKLIKSGGVTSNIFGEDYAAQLASRLIDVAVAHFED